MNYKKIKFLEVLRFLHSNNQASQRMISKKLGLSLGKVNYIIKNLKYKGLIKFKNFKINISSKNQERKLNYFYILTTKGINTKIIQSKNYLRMLSLEFDKLKRDL